MAKEVRANRDFSERTTATARWAREQIKRQTGMNHFLQDTMMNQGMWGWYRTVSGWQSYGQPSMLAYD